jgi:hypothetical protein
LGPAICTRALKEWLPWITRRLIERAVSRLPESERERFEEEWWGHVNEWPGALAKIYIAYGYLSASNSIGDITRIGESPRVLQRIQEAGMTSRTFHCSIEERASASDTITAAVVSTDSPS